MVPNLLNIYTAYLIFTMTVSDNSGGVRTPLEFFMQIANALKMFFAKLGATF